MEGHAETCVERCCELAGKAYSMGYHQVSPEDVSAVQENCRFVLRSRNIACIWPDLEDLIYGGRPTCWHGQSPSGTKLVANDWHD